MANASKRFASGTLREHSIELRPTRYDFMLDTSYARLQYSLKAVLSNICMIISFSGYSNLSLCKYMCIYMCVCVSCVRRVCARVRVNSDTFCMVL